MALGSCRAAAGEHGGWTRPRQLRSPAFSYDAPFPRLPRDSRRDCGLGCFTGQVARQRMATLPGIATPDVVPMPRSSPRPPELPSSTSSPDTGGPDHRDPSMGSAT
jgi:hypothetical protein